MDGFSMWRGDPRLTEGWQRGNRGVTEGGKIPVYKLEFINDISKFHLLQWFFVIRYYEILQNQNQIVSSPSKD